MNPAPHAVTSASGMALFFGRPNVGSINIRDIAAQLARINRWLGAPDLTYSVAQHSVHVAELIEETGDGSEETFRAALHGLCHDAHEYMMGDHPAALKRYVADRAGWDVLGQLAESIDAELLPALGLAWPVPQAIRRRVERADRILAASERRDLMPDAPAPEPALEVLRRTIKPWTWPKAEERFLNKYADLCAVTGVPNQLRNW